MLQEGLQTYWGCMHRLSVRRIHEALGWWLLTVTSVLTPTQPGLASPEAGVGAHL